MPADKYGDLYWIVGTQNEEFHIYADEMNIENGTLIFTSKRNSLIKTAFGNGTWTYCFPASVIDGTAINVEHYNTRKDRIYNGDLVKKTK